MKKIMLLLFLAVGITAQAQTFDFECADPLISGSLTVNSDMGLGESIGTHSEKVIIYLDTFEYSYKINIPDGYVASGVDPYTWTGVTFSGNEDDSFLSVSIVLDSKHIFGQDLNSIPFDISSHIKSSGPGEEVRVNIIVKDDITDTAVFVETKSKTVYATIPLPNGQRVVSAISATQWFYVIGNNEMTYKISSRKVGSASVGVTLRVTSNFNYDQVDFDLDLEHIFGTKVGIPEVNPGDLGNWFFYDAEGTPQDVPETSTRVFANWKISDDATDSEEYELTQDNLMHTFGDSNLHVVNNTFNKSPVTNSSDIAFPGIEGGDYDGYALIHNGNSADYFAKWTAGSKSYKVLIITHDDFTYSGNYFIGGTFIDIR